MVSAAFQQTQRAGSGELGTLSIAYTPTVAEETLPPLIAAVHDRLPDVRVRTCEMWQAEMAAAVEAGRFDIGLARCPILHDDLESAVIRDEPLGITLADSHALARNPRVRIEDLGAEKLLIWPRVLSPGFHDRVVDSLRAHGFLGPVQEFENLNATSCWATRARAARSPPAAASRWLRVAGAVAPARLRVAAARPRAADPRRHVLAPRGVAGRPYVRASRARGGRVARMARAFGDSGELTTQRCQSADNLCWR